jgi:hypothetical protein
VTVEVEPDRKRRVGDRLHERRPPVRVDEIEVVVVGKGRLAPELEVGVAVGSARAPAAPDRGTLPGDADQIDAAAALALGARAITARDLLLRLARGEAHDRDLLLLGVALDRPHVGAADLAEHGRRGDRVAAVEQKADHPSLAHQLRHVALEEDAVDRAHLQGHMLTE